MKAVVILVVMLVLPVLFIACTREHNGWEISGETLITFHLSLPNAGGKADSRALTIDPNEENHIDRINIIALTQKNSGEWIFDYMATNIRMSISGNALSITASVKVLTTPQQFVIIANGAEELNDANPVRGEKITAIETRLICTTGSGEWPARNNGVGPFKPIPMYGRTASYTVNATGNNVISSPKVQLIRMLARIEVSLKSTISNFILEEACLFNYKTAGYVSYTNSGMVNNVATTPAVPVEGNHPGNPVKEPTVMFLSDKSTVAKGIIKNSIYTFESPAIESEEAMREGTALVVGGFFNGSSNITYYRIDLKWDTNSTAISDGILRNHSYAVEIKEVKVAGHPTPMEAYLGKAFLYAEVKSWNNAEQQVNGKQYFLNVSETKVILTAEDNDTQTITAQTNYDTDAQGFPAGIRVGKITYSADGSSYGLAASPVDDWLSYENLGTLTDAELVFTGSRANFTEKRYAKVELSAGNFTRIIDVEQQ